MMRKGFWSVVLFVMLTGVPQAAFCSMAEGDPSLIKTWVPVNPCITYYYGKIDPITGDYKPNSIDGVEVSFQIPQGGTQIFRNWHLLLDGGGIAYVPFVMEVTLLLNDAQAIADIPHKIHQYAEGTRGESWDFAIADECTSDEYPAYIDSHFEDDGWENIGIGILEPYRLKEGHTYKFWIKLEQLKSDLDNVSIQLRFRLNLDLGRAGELNYPSTCNFSLGTGWEGESAFPYDPTDYQNIAERHSFAITFFKSIYSEVQPYDYSGFGDNWVKHVYFPERKPVYGHYCNSYCD